MKKFAAPLFLLAALTGTSHAVVLASYNFVTVSNSLAANATSASVAPALPGLTASVFSVTSGVTNTYSISSGTMTAYGESTLTPAIASIYTSARYHTFSLTLTDPYSVRTLSFETGGSNSSGGTVNFAYGAQVQIGSGAFTDLAVSTGSLASQAGNYFKTGDYSVDLGNTFENLDDTTVTVRIFLADDINSSMATPRIKNVQVNSVPEPSALVLGALGLLGLLRRKR